MDAWGEQHEFTGGIKDAQFVIEKERKNTLPIADRLFESAPSMASKDAEEAWKVVGDVYVLSPVFALLAQRIRLLRAKQDVLQRHYGNCLSGGYGHFHTPLLELFLVNKRSNRYAYGMHGKHSSSGQSKHLEESHNMIQLYGKLLWQDRWLGSDLCYIRDLVPLYLAQSGDQAKQVVNQIRLSPNLSEYTEGPLRYGLDTSWQYTAIGDTNEWQLGLQGRGSYGANDSITLRLITDLECAKYERNMRYLGRLTPTFSFGIGDLDIEGGVNLVGHTDATNTLDTWYFYPILELQYPFYEGLLVYAGIRGDVQRHSLQSLSAENPRLIDSADIRHTNQKVHFQGVRGDVWKLGLHAGFSAGSYRNFHCLKNSAQHEGLFEVCYASKATMYHYLGELVYANQEATWTTRLRGDWWHYTLKDLKAPWHRPRYQLEALSTYHWHDKVSFSGSLYWVGGVEAVGVTGDAMVLPSVVDLAIHTDYWWNTRFAIFLHLNNLLANQGERYRHYPDRGFQLMAGITYTF